MHSLYSSLCLSIALACAFALVLASEQQQQQQQRYQFSAKDITDEMQLINKSLEGLLSELASIKREATGRLSSVKNSAITPNQVDQERIRQIKVSRFVLKRVAELELESLGMRDEMVRLFDLQKKNSNQTAASPLAAATAELTTDAQPSNGMPATTLKPEEEAAAIGFDLEALKKLGDQIDSEIEARQAQNPETIRGVHEQVIRLIDNMVQNYLGNMRRSIQRFNNFIGRVQVSNGQRPRLESPVTDSRADQTLGQSVVEQLESLDKQFRDFTMLWARTVGKQQSPLIDRIPPRGVELWRDFWDTVRRQVRRINQEFAQVTRDMGRLLNGRPSNTNDGSIPREGQQTGELLNLLYSVAESAPEMELAKKFQEFYNQMSETLSKEQEKMDSLFLARVQQAATNADRQTEQTLEKITTSNDNNNGQDSLFDELDDEATRAELNRNVVLRQQIQQEINVFGSIFDIMRAFIVRLRDSASVFRDVLQPGAINSNDSVTPGPSIKPTVDQLLEETVNSQRNINGQGKPVLLPNKRPRQQ